MAHFLESWDSISSPLQGAFRYVVPPPEDRIERTPGNGLYYLLPFAMIVIMGGLARRPDTWALRLALFPFALVATLRVAFLFVDRDPTQAHRSGMSSEGRTISQLLSAELSLSSDSGTWGLQFAIKLLDYTISPKPILKMKEAEELSASTPYSNGKHELGPSNGNGRPQAARSIPSKSSPTSKPALRRAASFLYDGLELIFNLRGVGWEFGTGAGLQVPKQTRNVNNRAVFILQTIRGTMLQLFAIDVADTILRSYLGQSGGSIFAFGGNVFEKYAISTCLHIASGVIIVAGQFTCLFLE